MSTWLKLLPLRLTEISNEEFIEPDTEVDPVRDHVVGEMSPDSRKIYFLFKSMNEAADRTLLEAKYAKNPNERKDLLRQYAELRAKAEVMKEIFWISIKDEHGLWDRESIGVRKGFLVIWAEAQEQPQTFMDFFRGL